jgi:hypothetical protein
MKILIVGFVLLTLGLATAIPQWPISGYVPPGFGFSNMGKELQSDETATSEVFPVALVPVLVAAAPKVVALALDLLRLAVCDKTNTNPALQEFADIEEQNAQVMALVTVMNDLLTTDEKLEEVKQLKMKKSNLVAEAELFDGQWFQTLKSKLKSAIYKIGGAAKKLLCKQN